ncbi:hypothetical protein [Kitasatospora sp. GP82]|uniref:hypothetical protein n=1 Tax=Kitasatospora sp. GP82 TaxID=3035089 RepID=UPI0024733FE6|nr:hypothetical protein [Kitasatospora sp. GP82]MDH6126504.1 hypothetical protein [Kitasatospora sp. GP82]
MATYGEIRRVLRETNARWQALPTPRDSDTVVEHPLGVGAPERLQPASEVPPVRLAPVLESHPTSNTGSG